MQEKFTRIGIIQTAPLAGDFPNNLRAIVNGYRECLELGAQFVVAPAASVCGLEPADLTLRRSFIGQTRDCLEKISRELSGPPLLLAAYTRIINDEELYTGMVCEGEEADDPWLANSLDVVLTPYLLEKDCVTELESNHSQEIDGNWIYVDTHEDQTIPDGPCDLLIHLPCTPWHSTQETEDRELRSWEASVTGAVTISCRPVGTAGGNIYGGGSSIFAAGGTPLLRLPFFEVAAGVTDLSNPSPVLAAPEPTVLLCSALERGIRDTVLDSCYRGVCVPLDHPNSALLATLCIESLGTSRVIGCTFAGNEALAEKLGIECYAPASGEPETATAALLPESARAALVERLRAAMALGHAESRGLLLCSPLSRSEIMLGEFTPGGLSAGQLAPLGSLYSVDSFLLSEYLSEKYTHIFGTLCPPDQGNRDRIIHELADRNTAAGELLNPDLNYLFRENEVRSIQRRIVLSALKRTQLPTILQTAPQEQQLRIPVIHRLND